MSTAPFTLPLPPITLTGMRVRLVPLGAEHAPPLFALTPPDTFRYFLSWPREWTPDAFAAWLAAHSANPKTRAFAVTLADSGRVVGSTSFMDLDPANRALEIGATWYAPGHRGTALNPECKLLLLRHAFESLGCVRVTLKCDERNAHSRRAIAGIGAVFEGILRNHRIMQDGYIRNTAMFGITRDQWPTVRERLETRLRTA